MSKGNKPTKKEHYVQQAFLNNFISTKTDSKTNSKTNLLSCCKLETGEYFNTLAENIFFKDYLYELTSKKNLNDFEKEIKKFEDKYFPYIQKMEKFIQKCDFGNVTISEEIFLKFYHYMVFQILRLPIILPIIQNGMSNLIKYNEENNNEAIEILKKEYSKQDIEEMTTLFSIIKDDKPYILFEIIELIRNNHEVIIYKSKNRHFFTCNFPVLFSDNLINLNIEPGNNLDGIKIFENCHIAYPISPEICIFFKQKKSLNLNTAKIKKAKSGLLKRLLCVQCGYFQIEEKLILVSDKIHPVDKKIIEEQLILIKEYKKNKEASQKL